MEQMTGEFVSYIIDKALVLVPVLLIVGKILKSTPKCPDWSIPWALTILGIAMSIMTLGFSADAVVQGVLVAGAAVYGNQLWKQTVAEVVGHGNEESGK